MGEVYQATDTKLGRSVAVKILPAAFAADSDRLSRFRREAQVLASLNHPNIAQIYGIEESKESRCIVMELVEGETLQARIKQGIVPFDEALAIAKQIATALEAAHEKGIIHRDLKPGNVMLTKDGNVKVLDFGLAKASESVASNSSLSNSPTMVSMGATNAGMILGTAAYMSPEQARGRTVDARTDVFAFGCVLYEMLTGRPTFDGEDAAEILSQVLQREPDWTLLPSTVPPRIRELLRLCLQKNLKNRRQTAADVRIDIDQALVEPVLAAALPSDRKRSAPWTMAVVASCLAIGLAAGYFVFTRGGSAAPVFFSVLPPEQEDFAISITDASISPDGQHIAFTTGIENVSKKLWIRSLHSPDARMVEKSDGAEGPFWSPDSRWVGFLDRTSRKLKKASIEGGNPVVLADAPYTGGRFSGTWNREGLILLGADTGRPIYRVSANGGVLEPQTKVGESEGGHFRPFFLPDGRHFLLTVGSTDRASRGIYAGDLDSQVLKPVLTGFSATAVYSRSGHLLFVRESTLWAQAFDVSTLAVSGEAHRVVDSVSSIPGNVSAQSGFSISEDGTLLYRTGASTETDQPSQLMWFDRKGSRLSLVGSPEVYLNPRLSPDGRRIGVQKGGPDKVAVWLIDVATGTSSRLTLGGEGRFPAWSLDGGAVTFSTNSGFFQKSAAGAGSEETILKRVRVSANQLNDWSRDGKYLIASDIDKATNRDIFLISVGEKTGEAQLQAFAATEANEVQGQISPDGKWIAYVTDETGVTEIVVDTFPKPGNKKLVSSSGGVQPRWSRDGKELFYVSLDRKLMSVPVLYKETLAFGVPAVLFETPALRATSYGLGTLAQYDISPDGQRFLINTATGTPAGPRLHIVLNWPGLLDGSKATR